MDQAPNLFRAFTLVLGIFAVIIGSYAHYKSQWTDLMKIENYKEECEKLYEKTCPSRSLELYFVAMAIIAPAGSIIILLALLSRKEPVLEKVDAGFHLCVGLLQIIGGVVMIISANQIKAIVQTADESTNEIQFYDLKIFAGVISLVNGVCFIVVGVLTVVNIRKETKNDENMNIHNSKSSSSEKNSF